MKKLDSRQFRHSSIAEGEPNAEIWTSFDVSDIFASRGTDWELLAFLSENCAAYSFEG